MSEYCEKHGPYRAFCPNCDADVEKAQLSAERNEELQQALLDIQKRCKKCHEIGFLQTILDIHSVTITALRQQTEQQEGKET